MTRSSCFAAGRRARAAAVVFSAGALALLAGCSAGTPTPAAKPMSPRAALLLAARQADQLDTMAVSSSAQTNGSDTLESTSLIQFKPSLLMEITASVEASGQSLRMTEILSSTALYLKLAALSQETGKPWVKIPLSELKGKESALFSQLLQSAQNNNPQQLAKMLTASKDVRALGTHVIDGVRTTEYTGSYTMAAALAVLSSSQRTALAPELKQLTGGIHFTDWIDAQHHVRRTVVTETVSGRQITLTSNITAINQPLHIKVPPRRRVAVAPAGSL
jgi:hypothetical protein